MVDWVTCFVLFVVLGSLLFMCQQFFNMAKCMSEISGELYEISKYLMLINSNLDRYKKNSKSTGNTVSRSNK